MDDRVWPLVSIVFLAFNRSDELAISLEHVLERLDYPADRLEVIVVDNASTDGTAEMMRERFPEVRLLRNPVNVGVSGWNVGMTTACGRWRLTLDDDCYISGSDLKTTIAQAEEHGADFVSFRVVSSEVPGYSFNDERPTGLLSFWGCAAMFSAEVIESEPFYDPGIFIWANELELTMRLLNRGFRHLFLADVNPVHMKGPSTGFNERSTRVNHKHFGYIAARHLKTTHAASALVNLLVHLILEGVSDDRRALLALPEVPRGFAAGLRRRQPVRDAVSEVYRRHFRHFLSPIPFLRSPAERLQAARAPDAVKATRDARIARWYAGRPEYYPATSGVLEL